MHARCMCIRFVIALGTDNPGGSYSQPLLLLTSGVLAEDGNNTIVI